MSGAERVGQRGKARERAVSLCLSVLSLLHALRTLTLAFSPPPKKAFHRFFNHHKVRLRAVPRTTRLPAGLLVPLAWPGWSGRARRGRRSALPRRVQLKKNACMRFRFTADEVCGREPRSQWRRPRPPAALLHRPCSGRGRHVPQAVANARACAACRGRCVVLLDKTRERHRKKQTSAVLLPSPPAAPPLLPVPPPQQHPHIHHGDGDVQVCWH
jgi:hypothetical protein